MTSSSLVSEYILTTSEKQEILGKLVEEVQKCQTDEDLLTVRRTIALMVREDRRDVKDPLKTLIKGLHNHGVNVPIPHQTINGMKKLFMRLPSGNVALLRECPLSAPAAVGTPHLPPTFGAPPPKRLSNAELHMMNREDLLQMNRDIAGILLRLG